MKPQPPHLPRLRRISSGERRTLRTWNLSFVEGLEERTLLSVTASLSPVGILDVALGAEGDRATIDTVGGTDIVVEDASTKTVILDALARIISGIHVSGSGEKDQGLGLEGTITLGGRLDVLGVSDIHLGGIYAAASASLAAEESLNVDAAARLSTRQIPFNGDPRVDHSVGDSGDILLESREVTIEEGASLLAQVIAGDPFRAGDIRLEANDTAGRVVTLEGENPSPYFTPLGAAGVAFPAGIEKKHAAILLSGADIEGGRIDINSEASDQASDSSLPAWLHPFAIQLPGIATSESTGLSAQVAFRSSQALVTVSDSQIAGETVAIGTRTDSKVDIHTVSLGDPKSSFTAAVGYGQVESRADTVIDGSTITAAGDIQIDTTAENQDVVKARISANLSSSGAADAENKSFAVAIASSTLESKTTVSKTSTIASEHGAVNIHSVGGEEITPEAEPKVFKDGLAGFGISLATSTSVVKSLVEGMVSAGNHNTLLIDPHGDVNPTSNTLHLPGSGLIDGQVVTYHHDGGGADIGNLADGGTYYVNVVGMDTYTLTTGRWIDLDRSKVDPSSTHTLTSPSSAQAPVAFHPSTDVDSAHGTITLMNHPYQTGDTVVYGVDPTRSRMVPLPSFFLDPSGMLIPDPPGDLVKVPDAPVGGLNDGAVYFVIKVDDNHIRLAKSYQEAIDAGTPVSLEGGGTGGGYSLDAGRSDGVGIVASLEAKNEASASTDLTGEDLDWQEAVADGPINLDDLVAGIKRIPDYIEEFKNFFKPPTQPATSGISGGSLIDLAGSFAVNSFSHDVGAEVGSAAVLRSDGKIDIASDIQEDLQLYVTAGATKPADGQSDATVAVAVGLGLYANKSQALVDGGAQLDAAETTSVDSRVNYPLRGIDALERLYDPVDYLSKNKVNGWSSFLDGTLGYSGDYFNTWVLSSAKEGKTSGGGSVAVTQYDDESRAVIGDGARINQDPDSRFRSGPQDVEVHATSRLRLVEAAGVATLGLDPKALLDLIKRFGPNAKNERLKNPFGAAGEETGIGASVLLTRETTTTVAEVQDGAMVHTGVPADPADPMGGLTIKAEEDGFSFGLAQSGADASKLGVGGSLVGAIITNKTLAHLGTGVAVGGGPVRVDSSDDSDRTSVAGAVLLGDNAASKAFGASISLNQIARDTEAFIGNPHDQAAGTAGTSIDSTQPVEVRSRSTGLLWSFSLAATAVASGEKRDEGSSEDVVSSGSRSRNDGDLSKALKTTGNVGIGIAGDVSLNVINAATLAYVNDAGRLAAGAVSVTSEDGIEVRSVSGSAVLNQSDADRSAGIAGSLSWNSQDDDTRAFLVGTAIQAGGLTVTAVRDGSTHSISGGGSGSTKEDGVAVVGSVSFNLFHGDTRADLSGVDASLVGDATIHATDRSRIQAIAGSISYGGKAGIGAAIAINFIGLSNHPDLVLDQPVSTRAYVEGSRLDTHGGAVSVSATSGEIAADPRILAVSGSLGLGFENTLAIAGTFSVNVSRDETDAYLERTTITDASDLTLMAEDDSRILSTNISGGGSDGKATGVALGYNLIDDGLHAYVEKSTVSLQGNLAVRATSGPTIQAIVAGGAGSDEFALGGSFSLNRVGDSTDVDIADAHIHASSVEAVGSITVTARDEATIKASTVGATGADEAAFGASFATNNIANTSTAYVDGSSVNIGAGVTLDASSHSTIDSLAVGIAGSGDVAGGGSVALNQARNTIDAHILASIVAASGPISVAARDERVPQDDRDAAMIEARAGGVAGSGGVAGGVSLATNDIADTITAGIDGSMVDSTAGGVALDASSLPTIKTLAVGAAGSADFAVGASVSLNQLRNRIGSHIHDSSVQASGPVSLTSHDQATINALTGGVSGSGEAAAGASFATNDIADTITADIDPSSVTSETGGVRLDARSVSDIHTTTVAGSGAGTFALGGSVSLNKIRDVINAHISDHSAVRAADSAVIAASDGSTIECLAGGASGAGEVAIGAALATNDVGNSITASLDGGSRVDAASASVVATEGATIKARSVGVAGAGEVSVTGGVGINDLSNIVDAHVSDGARVMTTGDISIAADDASSDTTLTGQAGGAYVGVGGALSINRNNDRTTADIRGGASATSIAGSVFVNAGSLVTIESTTVGLNGGFVGITGNVAVDLMSAEVQAYIADSSVDARANVVVLALSDDRLQARVGSATGGYVGVGGTVVVDAMKNTARAFVDGSDVAARGRGASAIVNRWDPETGAQGTEEIHGLAVVATSSEHPGDDGRTLLAINGTGGLVGVAGVVTANIIADTTDAHIAGSRINSDEDFGGAVIVRSHSAAELNLTSGGDTGGFVGVNASVNRMKISSVTRAYISGGDETGGAPGTGTSVVYSGGGVEVSAVDRGTITLRVVGFVSGAVAVAGTVSVADIGGVDEAFLHDSDVYSLGKVEVHAVATERLHPDVGTITSGVGGTGATVSVNTIHNTVRAQVLGGRLDATAAISVAADSDESIDPRAGTGALDAASLVGTVAVTTIETTTEAIVQDGARASLLNQDARFEAGGAFGPDSGQTVAIRANDTALLDGETGTAAIGIAGFGASVDVGAIRNRTVAAVGPQARINAVGDVSIRSHADRTLNSTVVAFSGGAAGLSGAVSVQSLGADTDGTAAAEFGRTKKDDPGTDLKGQSDAALQTPDVTSMVNYQKDGSSPITDEAGSEVTGLGQPSVDDAVGAIAGNDRVTSAFVADAPGSDSAAEIASGGSIEVESINLYHLHQVTGTAELGIVAAGAGIGVASIRNTTEAYVGSNNILRAGGNLTIHSQDREEDDATDTTSFGGAAGGIAVDANAAKLDLTSRSDAHLGSNASADVRGAMTVRAEQGSHLIGRGVGYGGGLAAAGAVAVLADVDARATAAVFGGARVGGAAEKVGSLSVLSDAVNLGDATGTVAHSGLGATGASYGKSTVKGDSEAYLGAGADIHVEGNTSVQARSGRTATAALDGRSDGGLSVAGLSGTATTDGSTRAHVDGNVESGSLDVTADSGAEKADSHLSVGSVGALSVGAGEATSRTSGVAEALLGPSASVHLGGGAATVSATGDYTAMAASQGVNGGLTAISLFSVLATNDAGVSARSGGTLDAGSLAVTATSTRVAAAKTSFEGISGIGGSGSSVTSSVTGQTEAGVDDASILLGGAATMTANGRGASQAPATTGGATTARPGGSAGDGPRLDPGSLTVQATSTDAAIADAQSVAGGVVSGTENVSDASVKPVVKASIGGRSVVNAASNITVMADESPDGDATIRGASGGVATVGSAMSHVLIGPNVTSSIAGSVVHAGGSVSVRATSAPRKSGDQPDDHILSVDPGQDTLQVADSGLKAGDVVEYHLAAGDAPIAGLSSSHVDPSDPSNTIQRQYNVLSVDRDNLPPNRANIAFGATFDGSQVDPVKETITFKAPHHFQDGDAVVYSNTPGTTHVGGLVPGQAYSVLVIDDLTIKLLPYSKIPPKDRVEMFSPGAVAGDSTITLNGHGFTNGEAVTYHAPPANTFSASQVDVISGDDASALEDDPNANNIEFFDGDGNAISPGFTDGEIVRYQVRSGDSQPPVGIGLGDGGLYRVVTIPGEKSIRLKPNDLVSSAVELVRSDAGDQIIRTDGKYWADNGFGPGQRVQVGGTPGGTLDGTYTIAGVDKTTLILAPGDRVKATRVIASVAFVPEGPGEAAGDKIILDGASNPDGWDVTTLAPGQAITVSGTVGNDGNYTIAAINGSTIFLTTHGSIKPETAPRASIAGQPIRATFDEATIALTPRKNGVATDLVFAPGVGGDTITRTEGDWSNTTFRVGAQITVSDSANNDGTYTIASIDGATITLTTDGKRLVPEHLVAKVARTPGADEANLHDPDFDVHSLIGVDNLPIGGLQDGSTYYVINSTNGTFQLAQDAGSQAPITLDPTGLSTVARHSFTPVVDLEATGGVQTLRVDLTGDGGVDTHNGPQSLTGVGGTALPTPPGATGDGVSTATTIGSGGGVIGIVVNDADVTDSTVVGASIAAGLLTADVDVTVEGQLTTNSATDAVNGTGGLIGAGEATSEIYQDVHNTASVGTGSRIVAGANFTLEATTFKGANATTRAHAGGGIGVATSRATTSVVSDTESVVGSDAEVGAGGAIRLAAETGGSATSNSNASGLGFVASGDSQATTTDDKDGGLTPSVTAAKVSDGALLTAMKVIASATLSRLALNAHSETYGAGFASRAIDQATVDAKETTNILLDRDAVVTGNEGVTFLTSSADVNTFADSFARLTGIGIISATATNTTDLRSQVLGKAGAVVTAGPGLDPVSNLDHLAFSIDAGVGSPGVGANGHVSKRGLAHGKGRGSAAFNHGATIQFDSDVVIDSGGTSELVVDRGGNITRATNVSVDDGPANPERTSGAIQAGAIIVNDIKNVDPPGQVRFHADDEIGGSGGTWEFRDTLRQVRITNASAMDLIINNIDVVNRSDKPVVRLETPSVGITYKIRRFAPTLVQVENQGGSAILINGTIENPIGTTVIRNAGGDVRSTRDRDVLELDDRSSLISTNLLDIETPLGNVGESDGPRVNVDVIDAAGLPQATWFRTAGVDGKTGSIVLDRQQFFAGELVKYHAEGVSAGSLVGGLVSDAYYYVLSPAGGGIQLASTPGGPAIDFNPVGRPSSRHSLTPVSHFAAIAGGNVSLDVKARVRDTSPDPGPIVVDTIRAKGDVDIRLQGSVRETTVADSDGGVRVEANSSDQDYHSSFRPDLPSPAPLEVGIFGKDPTDSPSLYDFSDVDTATGDRTLAGLVAGGNIRIAAADRALVVHGITDIRGAGHIDVTARGDVTLEEQEGDFRVGRIATSVALVGFGTVFDPGNTVTLKAPTGAIVDTNGSARNISAGSLALSGRDGIGTLADPIETRTYDLAASAPRGGVFVANAFDLTLTAIGGLDGVTSIGNDVILTTSSGNLTVDRPLNAGVARLSAGSSVLQGRGGVITADALAIIAGLNATLAAAANDVTTLAIRAAGVVEFGDATGLTLGALTGSGAFSTVEGITSQGHDVYLQAGSGLTIDRPLDAGTGDVRLVAGTDIIQGGTGTITADGLGIVSGGMVALVANNDVHSLAVHAGGRVAFDAVGDLAVGVEGQTEVGVVDGETGSGHVAHQPIGREVAGTSGITAGGDLTLHARSLTEHDTARVAADRLGIIALGDVSMGVEANDVNVLAIEAGGNIAFRNVADLTIGSVGDPGSPERPAPILGVASGQPGGSVTVAADGSLTVAADVLAGGDIVLTTVDAATNGQDLAVMGGETVRSTGGDVTLRAGDNLTLMPRSVVSAAAVGKRATLLGNFGNQAPGAGSLIQILGRLVSNARALVRGDSGGDTIVLSPDPSNTADGNPTMILLAGSSGDDQYEIQLGYLSGLVQIGDPALAPDPDPGSDTATITAGPGADELTVSNLQPNGSEQTGGQVSLSSPSQAVRYTRALEYLNIEGADGNDTFHVQPSQTAQIEIRGGSPDASSLPPGDTLDFDAMNQAATVVGNRIDTAGGWPDRFQPVSFSGIETLQGLSIVAQDAAKKEGNDGTTEFTFTVTRTGDLGLTTTVDYQVAGSGDHPADAADFVGGALPRGTITFAPGVATQTITIGVNGDTLQESDESFSVTLSSPGTLLVQATATGTILDDDTTAGNSGFLFGFGSPGSNFTLGTAIATDSGGNVYMTGAFTGTVDVDPGPGTFDLTSGVGFATFVTKLDPSGNLIWARKLGGGGYVVGSGIAVDRSFDVFVTGTFSGREDFDPGTAASILTSEGGTDAFVAKLDRDGNLAWADRLGGAGDDAAAGIAVASDGSDAVYFTGYFDGTADFGPAPSAPLFTSAGLRDAFVTKLDREGTLVWAERLGGAGYDEGTGIAVDGPGAVYVTGYFQDSVAFGPGGAASLLRSAGGNDAFVAMLDKDGNLVSAVRMGGAGDDRGSGIAVATALDGSSDVYCTGYFEGTADFGPGTAAPPLTGAGSIDAFVVKLTLGEDGSNILWARRLGGTGIDTGTGIAVDGSGAAYVTGYFQDTANFDPGAASTLTSAGDRDAFVAKLDGDGKFVWARRLGGAGDDEGRGIAADQSGTSYVIGYFQGTADYDLVTPSSTLTSQGIRDAFVAKIIPEPGPSTFDPGFATRATTVPINPDPAVAPGNAPPVTTSGATGRLAAPPAAGTIQAPGKTIAPDPSSEADVSTTPESLAPSRRTALQTYDFGGSDGKVTASGSPAATPGRIVGAITPRFTHRSLRNPGAPAGILGRSRSPLVVASTRTTVSPTTVAVEGSDFDQQGQDPMIRPLLLMRTAGGRRRIMPPGWPTMPARW